MDRTLEILFGTADKIGDYDYNWNENKPGHSQELGYGRVNAYEAVFAAQSSYNPNIDLFTRDTADDYGAEPNETPSLVYQSPDIWVRNQPDGLENRVHQNPEYTFGTPVYVYLRVRNNGCLSTENDKAVLYWSKASTALTWPGFWTGEITDPVLMGDEIGTIEFGPLGSNEEIILEYEWYPPNPIQFEGINDQPWHFCLLSRILALNDPMTNESMGVDEWNIGGNVRNNNNIAWKNISVVDIIPGIVNDDEYLDTPIGASVSVGNSLSSSQVFDFSLTPSNGDSHSAFDYAEINVTLDETVWDSWVLGGSKGTNIKIIDIANRQIRLTEENATIENVQFDSYERGMIHLDFNFLIAKLSSDPMSFDYSLEQNISPSGEFVGGEVFRVNIPSKESFFADAGDDQEIDKNEIVYLRATEIDRDAVYNWYDPEGNLIHTGKEFSISPTISKKYKLEIITSLDGLKDYDEVEITVRNSSIEELSPNPASNTLHVRYDAQNASSAYLIITNTNMTSADNIVLDVEEEDIYIDVSVFETGVYSVILVADGEIVDQENLIIE